MGSRFISAVAFYGPKASPLREFVASVQAVIAEHAGEHFRPYSPDQVHATLIALNGTRDPATGAIVNEYYLQHSGAGRQMDLPLVMRTLAARFSTPLPVRIGGFGRRQAAGFTSRGQHPFERSFSVQGNAFVVIGWPVAAVTGAARPLDRLRREMNAANVLHKYHRHDGDVDDDLYFVVGHHDGAPAAALERAAGAVRGKLAAGPVELEIGIQDVRIVAADSHTLVPPVFDGGIPADEAVLLDLMSAAG